MGKRWLCTSAFSGLGTEPLIHMGHALRIIMATALMLQQIHRERRGEDSAWAKVRVEGLAGEAWRTRKRILA